MERRDYWDAVVRGWWLIAIFGLVGLGVALMLPKGHETTYYQSTAAFGAAPPAPQGGNDLLGGGISTDQITYYAGTDDVMNMTSRLSGLHQPPAVIRNQISLLGPPDANSQSTAGTSGQVGVVDAKVSASTPSQALALSTGFDEAMQLEVAKVAQGALTGAQQQTEQTLARVATEEATNTFPPGVTAQALQVQVARLQDYLASLVVQQPNTGFQVVQQPTAAGVYAITTGKTVNNSKLRMATGLGLGMLLGALAAIGAWLLDRRLKTAKRAQTAFGYPVVAEIPDVSSDAIEPYRMLWLSVFRQPLPLPPAEQSERLYEGESALIEPGYGLATTTGPPT
jgi:hypothetical protein